MQQSKSKGENFNFANICSLTINYKLEKHTLEDFHLHFLSFLSSSWDGFKKISHIKKMDFYLRV